MSIEDMLGAAGPIPDSPTFNPDEMDLDGIDLEVDIAQDFMEEVVSTVQDKNSIWNNSRDPRLLMEAISKPTLTPRLTNMVKNNTAATTTASTNPKADPSKVIFEKASAKAVENNIKVKVQIYFEVEQAFSNIIRTLVEQAPGCEIVYTEKKGFHRRPDFYKKVKDLTFQQINEIPNYATIDMIEIITFVRVKFYYNIRMSSGSTTPIRATEPWDIWCDFNKDEPHIEDGVATFKVIASCLYWDEVKTKKKPHHGRPHTVNTTADLNEADDAIHPPDLENP